MASPPSRANMAGTPSNAEAQAWLLAQYDYITALLGGAGTAAATLTEQQAARTALGVGAQTGKNLLINSLFTINQRGYVSGTAVGSANTYTIDRWRVVTSGQSLSWTASGNRNILTAPAAGVEQVVEGNNIFGGSYVLNWTGTATATVNGTARAKGEVFTLVGGVNATVRFIGGTVDIPQLERGVVATVIEDRMDELRLCQRYYSTASSRWFTGYASDTSIQVNGSPIPVTLRASPTVSFVGTDSNINVTSVSALDVTASNINFSITPAAAGWFRIRITGFTLSAEL